MMTFWVWLVLFSSLPLPPSLSPSLPWTHQGLVVEELVEALKHHVVRNERERGGLREGERERDRR